MKVSLQVLVLQVGVQIHQSPLQSFLLLEYKWGSIRRATHILHGHLGDMYIDLKNLVSISEANQNFSKVARMVDEDGVAVILKNNTPRYVLIDYSKLQDNTATEKQLRKD